MAEFTTITLSDVNAFKRKALQWAVNFRSVCLLDSNDYPGDKYRTNDWVLAADAIGELLPHGTAGNDFARLREFQAGALNSSIFGFFTYDLKNQIEKLQSKHPDGLGFPEIYFFAPRYIFRISGDKLTLNRNYPETFEMIELINSLKVNKSGPFQKPSITCSTGKETYVSHVEKIKAQIASGDYYEMNYCLEFKAENVQMEPVEVFSRLNEKAKAPFSCFFKLNDKYLLCASPERFLKKEGSKLISQPIKGTVRKGITEEENRALQEQLKNNEKERAENVMIVDLVRNDLARSSSAGSVKVEELCGVYSFNTVNQMISTVLSQIRPELDFSVAIKNAFPMGSMTGAPKIEVMKNIEQCENFKRGLYSGSVGYITPDGDFDLNVVIRSILYNATTGYVALPAGGAITYDSDPEKEYEEILLKARNMVEVLTAETPL